MNIIIINKVQHFDQCYAFSILWDDNIVHIVVVYDSTYHVNIRKLWMDLHILRNGNAGPWIFLGDFNSI